MGEPFKAGCASPKPKVKNVVSEVALEDEIKKEVAKPMIKVGQPVPNFELSGYHKGEFKQFSLEEFKGKWVLLCFYPGDFTFV
jgi:peroxiredoxin (alkyl hydroperoxide reductase subunit C)